MNPLAATGETLPHVMATGGPNGHLFYVGGDLMTRRGMLPIIMLPDGDLRIVLHLVPFLNFDYLGECPHWRNRGRVA